MSNRVTADMTPAQAAAVATYVDSDEWTVFEDHLFVACCDCGLAVWVLPNHDLDSAEWSASLVPRVAACEPRALYLAPSNWGPGVDAQVVLNRGPAEPRGALPPDAPWGATWDWIDGRAGFYDRLIDYCIGEGWEIPVWVQQASARLTRWQEQEGLYGP